MMLFDLSDASLCCVYIISDAATIARSHRRISLYSILYTSYLLAAYEVPNDNLIAELADEYDAKFVDYEDEVGSFERTKEFSAYGLRGSTSNEDEEFESVDFVDWNRAWCDSKKSMVKWKAQIDESSGKAKVSAQKRYEEAKAASLRAKAHIDPKAKAVWEKAKEKSTSIFNGAKSWFHRHRIGEAHDDEEDEFDDVQCWTQDGEDYGFKSRMSRVLVEHDIKDVVEV